jgi:hypothetical protein
MRGRRYRRPSRKHRCPSIPDESSVIDSSGIDSLLEGTNSRKAGRRILIKIKEIPHPNTARQRPVKNGLTLFRTGNQRHGYGIGCRLRQAALTGRPEQPLLAPPNAERILRQAALRGRIGLRNLRNRSLHQPDSQRPSGLRLYPSSTRPVFTATSLRMSSRLTSAFRSWPRTRS